MFDSQTKAKKNVLQETATVDEILSRWPTP
jgi:hypothetical protein